MPLLAYLLIAAASCLFDLSTGWLTAVIVLGFGAFSGLCYLLAPALPPLVKIPSGSMTYTTNPLIPVLPLIAIGLVFWSGTLVIDRKLNN